MSIIYISLDSSCISILLSFSLSLESTLALEGGTILVLAVLVVVALVLGLLLVGKRRLLLGGAW